MYTQVVFRFFLACLFSVLLIQPAIAQVAYAPGDLVLIETNDDNEFYGVVLDKTSTYVRVRSTVLGEVAIPLGSIKKIDKIEADRIKGNVYWSANPLSTRYFWAPNGYGLRKGEGYYQNVWVFFNQMSVGLSDNASIGVGLIPTFLFGAEATPIWVTPKVSLPVSAENNNVHLGLGGLLGTVAGVGSSSFGILYGVMTVGSPDTNVNIGLGMGYLDNDWAAKPTLTLSAMIRTGKRGYFLTENYLLDWGPNGFGVVSFGGRTVGKRLSFDYGLMIPVSGGQTNVAIPWIGIAVPFGK